VVHLEIFRPISRRPSTWPVADVLGLRVPPAATGKVPSPFTTGARNAPFYCRLVRRSFPEFPVAFIGSTFLEQPFMRSSRVTFVRKWKNSFRGDRKGGVREPGRFQVGPRRASANRPRIAALAVQWSWASSRRSVIDRGPPFIAKGRMTPCRIGLKFMSPHISLDALQRQWKSRPNILPSLKTLITSRVWTVYVPVPSRSWSVNRDRRTFALFSLIKILKSAGSHWHLRELE